MTRLSAFILALIVSRSCTAKTTSGGFGNDDHALDFLDGIKAETAPPVGDPGPDPDREEQRILSTAMKSNSFDSFDHEEQSFLDHPSTDSSASSEEVAALADFDNEEAKNFPDLEAQREQFDKSDFDEEAAANAAVRYATADASAEERPAVAKFLANRGSSNMEEHPQDATKPIEYSLEKASTESNHDPAAPSEQSLETTMTDLMLGKSGLGSSAMGAGVGVIKKLLVDSMIPKVEKAHQGDQDSVNKLFKMISGCGTARDSAAPSAKLKFNTYQFNSREHKKCRVKEAMSYTTLRACKGELESIQTIKKLKCDAFTFAKKKYGNQIDNGDITKKSAGEAVEVYITRVTTTFCGSPESGQKGMMAKYMDAKTACSGHERKETEKLAECKIKENAYLAKKAQCDQFQDTMDSASCQRAIIMKDACESYSECYTSKLKAFNDEVKRVRIAEKDRKAEWRGLKRIECLITAFSDGKVAGAEVDTCKKKSHSTSHLDIMYPIAPKMVSCTVPNLYPSTGAYKRAEFAKLPALARGKESEQCSGFQEISTTPKAGSPQSCKCSRVVLNGEYSAGPIVKCTNCLDVSRSMEKNSCPQDTKLFSPASKLDWETLLKSAGPLRDPHWIVDLTRPQNGCAGCTDRSMNSGEQQSWRTSDGSPWWLRSTTYTEPSGDYKANCYMNLWKAPFQASAVTFNDGSCNYHSKSYYCQPVKMRLQPAQGSPPACKCSKVHLTGRYSAGSLVKCEQCLDVSRSTQKNSCPRGMKIFSPRSREDWKTVVASAGSLSAPSWIVDITRPDNRCGGCTKYSMQSNNMHQQSWRTSDGSAWWLRSTKYSEPNGDYTANCYMGLSEYPANENSLKFNDASCKHHSTAYYCQPKASAEDKGMLQ